MKKTVKLYSLIVFLTVSIVSVFAAPRFGLAGQGTPNYKSDGTMICDPGWHWCKTMYMEVGINRSDLFIFEATENGDIIVTLPADFHKRFAKMLNKNVLTISHNVMLDSKLSELLKTDLKVSNLDGNIVIKPGQFKLVKGKEGRMSISLRRHDYVGHVTLLK
ncbi:MAG: hypothetical protein JNL75_11675 [Chitinophagales bacterium]|nr:hypothetical protein [Chitinophagales bacterium]